MKTNPTQADADRGLAAVLSLRSSPPHSDDERLLTVEEQTLLDALLRQIVKAECGEKPVPRR